MIFAAATVSEPEPVDVPESYRRPDARLLEWQFVERALSESTYYWLTSVTPRDEPHAVPLWGVYLEQRVCVDGHPQTRWLRNLERNPSVTVHLPDPERVVIVTGVAERLADDALDEAGWSELDRSYAQKYGAGKGSPWLVVHPRKVVAWDGVDLASMTRWFVRTDRGGS